jgi:hypothetical protein
MRGSDGSRKPADRARIAAAVIDSSEKRGELIAIRRHLPLACVWGRVMTAVTRQSKREDGLRIRQRI